MWFSLPITLLQYWRQIALVAILGGIFAYHWNAVRAARNEGFAMCEAKASADISRRIKDALESERGLGLGAGGGRLREPDRNRRDD